MPERGGNSWIKLEIQFSSIVKFMMLKIKLNK